MNPPGPDDFRRTANTVRTWHRPLLLSHTKPDGDAIGSLVAMRGVLRRLGVDPIAVVFDEIPDRYRYVPGDDPLTMWDAVPHDARDRVDGVLVLDTCAYGQIAPIADWLRSARAPIVVVDHHISRDDLPADCLVDEQASAACLILLDWFQAAGWSIDRETAEALFVGIATDSGWFRHSNTDARTLDAARRLVDMGVEPHATHDRLFQRESEARFRLRAAAGQRLELHADNQLAITSLPGAVFGECGAALAETEDLVNEPLRIATVVLSAMLVEQDDGLVRVGLRSRAPMGNAFPDVDVAAIARAHGGGGHRRAAGLRIRGPLDVARQNIIEALRVALSG